MNWLMWDKFRVEIILRTLQIPIFMVNEADLGFYHFNPSIYWNTWFTVIIY